MRPEPVFDAPWHGEVFALTVHLNETGHFDWSDWAAALGAMLRRHGLAHELNGGEDYWAAWLDTLEEMIAARGWASPRDVDDMRAAWEQAYLTTPHGKPVRLG